MAKVPIHLMLREGFEHDEVEVRIDGTEVFRRGDVTTGFKITRAIQFDVEREPGPATLVVRLPGRGVEERVQLEVDRPLWVGVTRYDSEGLRIDVQASPFLDF